MWNGEYLPEYSEITGNFWKDNINCWALFIKDQREFDNSLECANLSILKTPDTMFRKIYSQKTINLPPKNVIFPLCTHYSQIKLDYKKHPEISSMGMGLIPEMIQVCD